MRQNEAFTFFRVFEFSVFTLGTSWCLRGAKWPGLTRGTAGRQVSLRVQEKMNLLAYGLATPLVNA